jgi:DNA-binding NarL/FixJ family response regulator
MEATINMKQLQLFVQEPQALKNWSNVTTLPKKILYSLQLSPKEFAIDENLLLIQLLPDASNQLEVENLLKQQYHILLFSNVPSAQEGMQWFQKGIKGYLNTFAHPDRIEQAVNTILTGNIWLGQSVMQSMIQAISNQSISVNEGWKETLTEREIETADWILQGKSNLEIANAMNISERTVKAHVHNLLDKLGAKDRLNLVIKIQNWPRESS